MIIENLRLSLRQLWAHKLRSFLTVLSITIGAAAIVAMTSLAQSGLATLTRGIEEIGGTRFIWIIPDEPKAAKDKRDLYVRKLTLGDRRALGEAVPNLESIVATYKFYNTPVSAEGRPETTTTFLATEPSYFSSYKMKLKAGRILNATDMKLGRRVLVIGHDLKTKLFKDLDPMGQEIVFRGDRFEVVGVLAPNQKSGVKLGYNWDEIGIMPITAPGVGTDVEEISLTVKRTEDGDLAIRTANAILMHRHHGVDNFQFLDFGGLLKNFYTAFAIMKAVVGLIASVALLIGGVGVMNIMMVSVNERMREIGLRKALGATKLTIRAQFLTEAVVLSVFGAGIGVALGVATTKAASAVITMLNPSWVSQFSYGAVLVSVVASAAIGVFFGWYPAKRASELEPIACLRHE
jgi:putative ABC transport system permease protein